MAKGSIISNDGAKIDFSIRLDMQREFREETSIIVRAGDAIRKDPLVLNFDGQAARLSPDNAQEMSFDLDGDGNDESFRGFSSNSGYLAIDINHNGKIDSGLELFGPSGNNGFLELAKLDTDGNGWIDENDDAFKKLSVWNPSNGTDAFRTLSELGIGAIGLTHIGTPFHLRGNDNDDLGKIKSTGIYLMENGTANTIQEIDLTV